MILCGSSYFRAPVRRQVCGSSYFRTPVRGNACGSSYFRTPVRGPAAVGPAGLSRTASLPGLPLGFFAVTCCPGPQHSAVFRVSKPHPLDSCVAEPGMHPPCCRARGLARGGSTPPLAIAAAKPGRCVLKSAASLGGAGSGHRPPDLPNFRGRGTACGPRGRGNACGFWGRGNACGFWGRGNACGSWGRGNACGPRVGARRHSCQCPRLRWARWRRDFCFSPQRLHPHQPTASKASSNDQSHWHNCSKAGRRGTPASIIRRSISASGGVSPCDPASIRCSCS